MEVHSTRVMAARAADLSWALLREPERVPEILRRYGEADPVSVADLAALRQVAERIVEVFAAPGVPEAARLLNGLFAEHARPPRLTDHDGSAAWHLHVDTPSAGWAQWFASASAMALAVLLADLQRLPGGLCSARSCGRPYLDLGGGSARRYCSSRCATRERVAAHRAARGG
ncbi:CGNR zinc finger domain-containing protein [Nonomuraea sp. NPDC050310]|uniref:CGNR zinc finger domain-containing protein n=1 Tax=unclassified Nonomuraea TaxID=2593643 RepID=UPI0033E5AB22